MHSLFTFVCCLTLLSILLLYCYSVTLLLKYFFFSPFTFSISSSMPNYRSWDLPILFPRLHLILNRHFQQSIPVTFLQLKTMKPLFFNRCFSVHFDKYRHFECSAACATRRTALNTHTVYKLILILPLHTNNFNDVF